MWRLLKEWIFPPKPISLLTRVIDFTQPRKDHWLRYQGGDHFDSHFSIRGHVIRGDEVLIRMQSGRVGCYSLFSVIRDFSGQADWLARGAAVGYADKVEQKPPMAALPRPQITRLLGDGTWRVQPDSSKLAALSSGFTLPTSEFWKVFARNEACGHRANSLRTTGNL